MVLFPCSARKPGKKEKDGARNLKLSKTKGYLHFRKQREEAKFESIKIEKDCGLGRKECVEEEELFSRR